VALEHTPVREEWCTPLKEGYCRERYCCTSLPSWDESIGTVGCYCMLPTLAEQAALTCLRPCGQPQTFNQQVAEEAGCKHGRVFELHWCLPSFVRSHVGGLHGVCSVLQVPWRQCMLFSSTVCAM